MQLQHDTKKRPNCNASIISDGFGTAYSAVGLTLGESVVAQFYISLTRGSKEYLVDSISFALAVCRMVISSQKDDLAEVLSAVATSDARAAAQAIMDAHYSSFPREQIQAAATLLRSAHQGYTDAANRPLRFLERFESDDSAEYKSGPFVGNATKRQQARFNAAAIALALAGVFKMLDDDHQARIWRDRAEPDFLNSYKRIPTLRHSDIGQVGSYPGRVSSQKDIKDYRDACDRLLAEFEQAYASIT
jgi:hypothetical protein